MKYVVTRTEDGLEEMFLFPDQINHDAFAEILSYIKVDDGMYAGRPAWKREVREPISAGFVNSSGCYGKSETLGLESRKEDTALLSMQYGVFVDAVFGD